MSKENGAQGRDDAGFGEDLALEADQLEALEALLQGETVTDAAERAGVHRSTVHRWKSEDPEFRAALNRGRQRAQQRIEDRLLQAAEQAADTVYEAVVEDGDVKTAMQLLKGLGMLDGKRPEVGATEAWAYRLDWVMAKRAHQRMAEGIRRRKEFEGPLRNNMMEVLSELLQEYFEGFPGEISEQEILDRWVERAIAAGLLEEDPGYGVVHDDGRETAPASRKVSSNKGN